jgi:predicted phage tail protein
LCALVVFSFLSASFTYAAGVLEKTGTAGAVIQGAKLGKRGLGELTKYGQRLVTDDNKTEEELEQQIKQYSQQETIQINQNSNQQTTQNKGILDNFASSMSDSTDKLVSQLDKSTKPLQDTAIGVGQLFSKVKDKVSGSDKESEVIEEQSEVLSSGNKNKDNNGSGEDGEEASVKFADQSKLNEHFAKHSSDFGSKNALDYQTKASKFLTQSKSTEVLEKVRANGDIVRFNPTTNEFGIISKNGNIRTYYKPNPSIHGESSNLEYFNAQ